jgi:hypothetical protein
MSLPIKRPRSAGKLSSDAMRLHPQRPRIQSQQSSPPSFPATAANVRIINSAASSTPCTEKVD